LPPDVTRGFAPPFTLRENWRAAQPRVDVLDGLAKGQRHTYIGRRSLYQVSQKRVSR